MAGYNRREFLGHVQKTSLAGQVGLTILADAQSARATPANDKIGLGVMGIRGRGYPLMMGFAQREDCEIAYLADVNTALFDALPPSGYQQQVAPEFRGTRTESIIKTQGRAPKCVSDFRRVLDDDRVDAVAIATPDHWHAPATVLGLPGGQGRLRREAGCHSCWEGRKMVKAARKYKRIVQAGTRTAVPPYNMAAKKFIEDGKLGRHSHVPHLQPEVLGNIQDGGGR